MITEAYTIPGVNHKVCVGSCLQTKLPGIASAQTASGGSVKLGNIYDEHKVVSVKMILDDNVSNQDFFGTG